MEKLLKYVGAFTVGVLLIAGVQYIMQPTPAEEARQVKEEVATYTEASAKSEFMAGCTEEGNVTTCECLFNALTKYHGDKWWNDEAVVLRMSKGDLTDSEIKALQPCYQPGKEV